MYGTWWNRSLPWGGADFGCQMECELQIVPLVSFLSFVFGACEQARREEMNRRSPGERRAQPDSTLCFIFISGQR
jgi:hypothetical protein